MCLIISWWLGATRDWVSVYTTPLAVSSSTLALNKLNQPLCRNMNIVFGCFLWCFVQFFTVGGCQVITLSDVKLLHCTNSHIHSHLDWLYLNVSEIIKCKVSNQQSTDERKCCVDDINKNTSRTAYLKDACIIIIFFFISSCFSAVV